MQRIYRIMEHAEAWSTSGKRQHAWAAHQKAWANTKCILLQVWFPVKKQKVTVVLYSGVVDTQVTGSPMMH